ncbi:MAG TPA: NAD(P)/FAD-dependent oxidoreductase [Candidatus Limnocylindrales bacterium]|nr:NAD(P)/FAD-dependent oxidoreductase [Candidatus Limnocylindrales bacterium]
MASTNGASGRYDAVVIGGGHNGLVTAAYLARGGMRTLVLERAEQVGGAATTTELAPGAHVPTLAHNVGRLRGSIWRDLELRRHGLRLIAPHVLAFAPSPDGTEITLTADVAETASAIGARSTHDGERYAEFDRLVRSLGSFLGELAAKTPPDIDSPGLGDALLGLSLGRRFRGLGRHDAHTILRVLPMAVADFVAEAFETDALQAALAWRGVQYTAMGPWSASTAAVLLGDSAGNDGGAAGSTVYAEGGPGELSRALASAAQAAGAEIRTEAEISAVRSHDGRATGVVLANGDEIEAGAVVSAIDPKQTLTRLVDPVAAGPSLRWRAGNIRTPGMVSKVNLVLSGLPRFPAADGQDDRVLRGRIVVATGIDAMERAFDAAKYGGIPERPVLEATIPSLADPTLVAGAPEGTHVMSVLVQYTPYALGDGTWDERRDELGDTVLRTVDEVAPGLSSLVIARQVLTPLDLERDFGLTGGHPLHAEPGLDQFFLWRPLLGHARYRFAIDGLYLCGSGAHPGGGVTGLPGRNAAREILADVRKRRR